MEDRLFGLDFQLLFDAFVVFVVIMIMYVIMSNLFFKPVRAFIEQRKKAIQADVDEAAKLQNEALAAKTEYEVKLKVVQKEAEEILSASRKAALKQQDAIIDQAKSEASAIMNQADQEIQSEKERIKDDVRSQIGEIAMALTMQFAGQCDPKRGDVLLDEVLKEMDGDVWLRS